MRHLSLMIAAAALAVIAPAFAGESDAPKQTRPQQLAQSCRTLCVDELNACQRMCDSAATRIDCQARCQTRFNICTATCR